MKTWIEAHHSGGKKKINIQTKAGKEIYCHPLETTTQMNQTKKKKIMKLTLKYIVTWSDLSFEDFFTDR